MVIECVFPQPAGLDQIQFHSGERVEKLVPLRQGQVLQGLIAGGLADNTHFRHKRPCGLTHEQLPDPSVGGVTAALDQAAVFQLVENMHQRDRLKFQNVCQPALMYTFIIGKIGKSLPLRARQAKMLGPLLKALAQMARHIMQQKSQGGFGLVHSLRPCYSYTCLQ